MPKKKTPAKKPATKASTKPIEFEQLMFIGGSRNGQWFDVDVNRKSVDIIPRQSIDEVDLGDIGEGESVSSAITFTRELYTRREIAFADGDIAIMVHDEMSDLEAVQQLLEGYRPHGSVESYIVKDFRQDLPAMLRKQAE